jgi:hypothetical protein
MGTQSRSFATHLPKRTAVQSAVDWLQSVRRALTSHLNEHYTVYDAVNIIEYSRMSHGRLRIPFKLRIFEGLDLIWAHSHLIKGVLVLLSVLVNMKKLLTSESTKTNLCEIDLPKFSND